MTEEQILELKKEFLRQANVYLDTVFTNTIVPLLTGNPQLSDLEVVKEFVEHHCQIAPNLEISSRNMYEGYVERATTPMSHKKFSSLLNTLSDELGFRWKKKNKSSFWGGIALREDE